MTEKSTDETDLEEHIARSDAMSKTVKQLHVHMIDFLREKLNNIREKQPETVTLLSQPLAEDVVAELYESLTDELDDSDKWDEQDVLEGASLYMLMGIGMKDGPDDEEDDEDDDDDDDESEDSK